jgi:hypothetical protein
MINLLVDEGSIRKECFLVNVEIIWVKFDYPYLILNLPPFSGHTEKLNAKFKKEVCPWQRKVKDPTIMNLRERPFA